MDTVLSTAPGLKSDVGDPYLRVPYFEFFVHAMQINLSWTSLGLLHKVPIAELDLYPISIFHHLVLRKKLSQVDPKKITHSPSKRFSH